MKKEHNKIENLYSQTKIKKITRKIKLLGTKYHYEATDLLNMRLLLSVILFVCLLLFVPVGYIISPMVTIAFYFLFEYFVLDYPIKKRKEKLETEAILFLEILMLTLESKKNIIESLEITTSNVDGILSEEFRKSLSEVQVGSLFQESIKNMEKRIPSPAINQILLNLSESDGRGSNLEEILNRQLEYLREKRMLKTKAEVSKLPIKISLLSALFLIPLITLMILSPVLLSIFFGE